MDEHDKEHILYEELGGVLERLTREYNLTYPQVLGTLEILKADILNLYYSPEDEDEDEK